MSFKLVVTIDASCGVHFPLKALHTIGVSERIRQSGSGIEGGLAKLGRMIMFFQKNPSLYDQKLIPDFLQLSEEAFNLVMQALTLSDEEERDAFFKAIQPCAETIQIQKLSAIIHSLNTKIKPKPVETGSLGEFAFSNQSLTSKFDSDQQAYRVQFIQGVKRGAELIALKIGFVDCLTYLASIRYQIALEFDDPFKEAFGTYRKTEILTTPFSLPYRPYLEQFLASSKLGWKQERTSCGVCYSMWRQVKGEKICLTKLVLEPTSDRWVHTSPGYIEASLDEAKNLFSKAIAWCNSPSSESLKELMEILGQLHWWLAHAAPFLRGSAAITKMMIGAILTFHGIKITGSGELELDCIALIQDLEVFKNRYFDLLNSSRA